VPSRGVNRVPTCLKPGRWEASATGVVAKAEPSTRGAGLFSSFSSFARISGVGGWLAEHGAAVGPSATNYNPLLPLRVPNGKSLTVGNLRGTFISAYSIGQTLLQSGVSRFLGVSPGALGGGARPFSPRQTRQKPHWAWNPRLHRGPGISPMSFEGRRTMGRPGDWQTSTLLRPPGATGPVCLQLWRTPPSQGVEQQLS